MAIQAPGIYEIDEAQYHADPCPAPSLSHSIAKMLLQRSPRHAWAAHPRLGALTDNETDAAMDAGTIIHKLILGRGAEIVPITATYGPKHARAGQVVSDYKTDAAQEEREAIRAAGHIPVLLCALPPLQECAEAALEQMRAHPDLAAFFAPCRSEAVMAWQDGETWCRGIVDRLPDNPRAPLFDIKTTGMSAAPASWERRMIHEYATQAAFYRAGLRAIRGIEPGPMLFVVIETEAPYCMSVVTPAPSLLAYAEREIEHAIEVWRGCIATNEWPGYPAFTAHVELPGYMEIREEETAIRRQFVRGAKHNPDNAFNMEFAP
jgi:hypothetical protein